MREILFRGKRISNSKWVEGFMYSQHFPLGFRDDFYIRCYDTDYLVIPETVGQFTGLTDKNGVRIFEGDIVRYDVNYHDMVISYDVENWGGWLYEDMDDNMQAYSIYEFNLKDIAVIGNIHDNPDILKGGGDNG